MDRRVGVLHLAQYRACQRDAMEPHLCLPPAIRTHSFCVHRPSGAVIALNVAHNENITQKREPRTAKGKEPGKSHGSQS